MVSQEQSTDSAQPKPKKPWYRKWWVWVAGLMVFSAIVNGLGGAPESPSPDPGGSVESSSTEKAAEPAEPAEAAAEPEPEPEPELTAAGLMNQAFGSFTSVTKEGKGDAVVDLPVASGAIVTATHSGSGNFVIYGLDADNAESELLVNEIGKYAGTTFYATEITRLKVTADSAWKITIAPVSNAAPMSASNSGKGDSVLLYDGDAADFVMAHDGESNFVVQMLSEQSDDLLVNEIGKYSGTVPVGSGPALVIIKADGKWTLNVQ